jgi:hypothetical protein
VISYLVRFQVFTAAGMKMTAFWDIAQLRNVGLFQRGITALYPRRLSS